VAEVMEAHWRRFGRSYYQRHDFEGLELDAATRMIAALRQRLPDLSGTSFAGGRIASADDFSYTDPVDGSRSANQGIRLLLDDGSRVVCRLSGTGTEGATLRMYLERYQVDFAGEPGPMLAPLAAAARELLQLQEYCGRDEPTIIT
jgi:phosphoglucomutase